MRMRLTYDEVANAAYLYVVDPLAPGSVVSGEAAEESGIILDYDAEGRLLGIEFLAPGKQLRPETLAEAKRP
jgi:uncharacterized protein YuzE